jgi:transposase
MKAEVLGIDSAQHLFHVHGVTATGHIVLRKKLSRPRLLSFLAQFEPCLIGIEACGSAHDWTRAIRGLVNGSSSSERHWVITSVGC